MKTIGERVRETFSDDDSRDFAETYLTEALNSLRDTLTQFRRTVLLLALLIFLFELLTGASVREVSIGPFKLSDYSLLYKLLPLAIAYQYYELSSIIAMGTLGRDAIIQILNVFNPKIAQNSLEFFVTPYATLDASQLLIDSATEQSTWATWVLKYFPIPIAFILLFGAAAFEVYAFYRCFIEFGLKSVIVWLALACSLLLVALGLATLRQYSLVTE